MRRDDQPATDQPQRALTQPQLASPAPNDHGVWIDPDQCLIHGHEPIPAGYYLICGECFHCYPTADALRAAYRREIEAMAVTYQRERAGGKVHEGLLAEVDPLVVPPVEEITFCQECTHDF